MTARMTSNSKLHRALLCRALTALMLIALVWVAGCDTVADALKTDTWRFLQPDKTIRRPDRASIHAVLGHLGAADVTEEILPNAAFPVPADYEYSEDDYVIGPNDVLDIGIMDLFQPGSETLIRRQVETSGFIDLPLLDERIRAEGITSQQLRDQIKDAYSPDLLRDPRVSVTIVARRQLTFSILGSVVNPVTYDITKRDMRLLEALAFARGVTNPSIRYIYIIRAQPAAAAGQDEEPVDDITLEPPSGQVEDLPSTLPPLPGQDRPPAPDPGADDTGPLPLPLPESARPVESGLPMEMESLPTEIPPLPDLGAPAAPPAPPPPLPAEPEGDRPADEDGPVDRTSALLRYVETVDVDVLEDTADKHGRFWRYQDGQWREADQAVPFRPSLGETSAVPMGQGPEDEPTGAGHSSPYDDPTSQPTTIPGGDSVADVADPFDWNRAARSDMARIIAINLSKLYDGDPRMNIIIRANDIVRIPEVEIGEFYIMGEVHRPGVYSLTGRRVTVKMALAAAGNLGPLAWPSNSILVRRIGENQEQILPLNIEKIMQGEDSDVFLKPNDVIAVGTHVATNFMAVIRNAFRMTYGFGFIYDRNFGDTYTHLGSERFTRW